MTPPVTGVMATPPDGLTTDPPAKPKPPAPVFTADLMVRIGITALLVVAYFWGRGVLAGWLMAAWTAVTGGVMKPAAAGVWVVAALLAAVVVIWRKVLAKDKRFYAPLLITSILIISDAAFGILEGHPSRWLATLTGGAVATYSPTFIAILTTVLTEMVIGRFYYGKWPHLASAYISGISAGILVKSPALWPFILCGMISITSKYVLRIGERHLWNPTNFGVTALLFLAPQHVASLSVQAGNEVWAVLVIWVAGGIILYQLKLLHVSLAFLLTFIPLAFLRAWVTGHSWLTEIAPITSPMFQLFLFFMITDPKTVTKSRWSQVLVAVLVAVMETVCRLGFRDVHSLYHSLFIVGPIANLIEIAYRPETAWKKPAAPA